MMRSGANTSGHFANYSQPMAPCTSFRSVAHQPPPLRPPATISVLHMLVVSRTSLCLHLHSASVSDLKRACRIAVAILVTPHHSSVAPHVCLLDSLH